MKIIATDFDGTLSYNGKISDEDKEAIKRFRDDGNKFGVVTGRDLEMSFWVRNSFPDCDFIISCTGAIICDNSGKIIYEKKQIADDKLKDITEFAISHGAGSFSISDGLTRHYVDVRGNIPTDFSKIKEFNHCATWFYKGENAEALVSYINEKYPGEFSGYRNGGSVDMPPAGVSKSTGILAYASMFDNPEIYTVGDNYNDLGMIRDFESFAVSNAIPEVKAEANHRCNRIADMIEFIMEEK
ncbi:MAG: HAD-IIB family hydrolase [Clostridia bacterium]|nr:HAD-IIB family hydrolase [Clostridia bacterium]